MRTIAIDRTRKIKFDIVERDYSAMDDINDVNGITEPNAVSGTNTVIEPNVVE